MLFRPHFDEGSWSYRFRLKRAAHIRRLIEDVYREQGRCRIVDLGGTMGYWEILGDTITQCRCEVTLINLFHHPADKGSGAILDASHFTESTGDVRSVDSADNSFDIVHSNSVLEHVGDWESMRAMAGEISRLAPRYYVQVPYFWFPLEPHWQAPFVHWLPEQMRLRLLLWRDWGWLRRQATVENAMVKVQYARLLDKRQFNALFSDGRVIFERFCGLPKSLIAIRETHAP